MISSTKGRDGTVILPKTSKIKYKGTTSDNTERKNKGKFRFSTLVLMVLMVYMIFSLGGEIKKMNSMDQDMKQMETELKQLQDKNQELHKLIQQMQSNDYIEQEAREKLGLVKPGEKLIVPVQQNSSSTSQTSKDTQTGEVKD